MHRSKEVLFITGATGFLGKKVLRAALNNKNYEVTALPKSYCNLLYKDEVRKIFHAIKPDYVIHCAGFNGGINFNMKYPFDIFNQNITMGLNVIEACVEEKVKKIVSLVTSCAYNTNKGTLFPKDLMTGTPHDTVEAHGYAKRALQSASKYASQQYGITAVTACLPTLYGEGDSFDPNKTKVMGALIKKFVDAVDESKEVEPIWGTGTARRQFCYVEDAARLILDVLEGYDDTTMPCHIGCSDDIEIAALVKKIADIVGYTNKIEFDHSKPDGQHKKCIRPWNHVYTISNMTSLEDGIKKTVAYYRGLKNENRVCS